MDRTAIKLIKMLLGITINNNIGIEQEFNTYMSSKQTVELLSKTFGIDINSKNMKWLKMMIDKLWNIEYRNKTLYTVLCDCKILAFNEMQSGNRELEELMEKEVMLIENVIEKERGRGKMGKNFDEKIVVRAC